MNEKFFKEMMDIRNEQFHQLMRLCPTTHDYVLVSLKHKKLYHNWNEIQFTDDAEDKSGHTAYNAPKDKSDSEAEAKAKC